MINGLLSAFEMKDSASANNCPMLAVSSIISRVPGLKAQISMFDHTIYDICLESFLTLFDL
jgi:hypothetical protein